MAGLEDTWAGGSVVPSLSHLETAWQADILQINKERLSVSCGIRQSIKQCVIAGDIVSVFFRAENPLSGFLHKQQTSLRGQHSEEISSARCSLVQSPWMTQEISHVGIPSFFLPARHKLSQYGQHFFCFLYNKLLSVHCMYIVEF